MLLLIIERGCEVSNRLSCSCKSLTRGCFLSESKIDTAQGTLNLPEQGKCALLLRFGGGLIQDTQRFVALASCIQSFGTQFPQCRDRVCLRPSRRRGNQGVCKMEGSLRLPLG